MRCLDRLNATSEIRCKPYQVRVEHMTDAIKAAVEEMTQALELKLREVAELKKTINILSRQMGEEPIYPETDEEAAARPHSAKKLRPDQFFGKSPTTAAREYLELRNAPCTAEEILDAL